ncbi:PREDICTED: uncharacterized protein LOC104594886 [Nelumbo nucifera]|uniref:Uncharacterized protein LOC104594886 n=1 Tax=Nelumbo nucifera TaxID=4432 RepID=A0A1U7ZX72_NELNU|nr:PREDICTED: uncharacterized protein LOC104594886 [Nelumbo nucifera]
MVDGHRKKGRCTKQQNIDQTLLKDFNTNSALFPQSSSPTQSWIHLPRLKLHCSRQLHLHQTEVQAACLILACGSSAVVACLLVAVHLCLSQDLHHQCDADFPFYLSPFLLGFECVCVYVYEREIERERLGDLP